MAHEEEEFEGKPKKKLITRRRVLKATGGLVAATGLTAGGYILWGRHQRFSRDAQHTIRDHRVDWPATAPKMTILDASRVLMRNGPQGGNASDVKPFNTVAACVDPVAIDAWGCSLLGTAPDKLPQYVYIAQKMGLGDPDFARLKPVEITTG